MSTYADKQGKGSNIEGHNQEMHNNSRGAAQIQSLGCKICPQDNYPLCKSGM